MADKTKKQQPRKVDQKPKFGEQYLKDNPKAAKIIGAVSTVAPLALIGAYDQYDQYKEQRKREKLTKKKRFQNRTKMSGITSVKIQKLP